ncbi:MAG: YkgJ family cysteine cluster protein [Phycisphaerales bacterium]|nr:YkgJ family cysteine cluster protein [Phycisphaerales bacterium]
MGKSKPTAKPASKQEWFDKPDPTGTTDTGEAGLRFTCTQCGNCCTGPTGFVLFTDVEAQAMAKDLKISKKEFYANHTRETIVGRSLNEIEVDEYGYDCVFLTRDEQGKTGCSVYGARPEQCRTWPFWKSNLIGKRAWREESEGCPGMDQGELHSPAHIRLTRDRVEI